MPLSRRQMLQAFLEQNPTDAFARYGLAMDLAGGGESEAALAQFRLLQQQHPDYAAAYQQAGQLLAALDRHAEARTALQAGIAAATRQGNLHAGSEMQALLDQLG